MVTINEGSKEMLTIRGTLKGHNGWVTQIATSAMFPDTLVSSSRDKTVLIWKLSDGGVSGVPHKSLHGHNHFVSDVTLSSDGQYALSGSWDRTMRLWELKTGVTTRLFVGHTKDVLSVAFSPDNRQIVSGSRDRTIRLWNTLGVCKFAFQDDCHDGWVSCVRISPNTKNPIMVSCGWDKAVKVWNLGNCRLTANHKGHNGYLNVVIISPDASLAASGGKELGSVQVTWPSTKMDGRVVLWDLGEQTNLHVLEAGHEVNALVFSPNRYWLCAAAGPSIKIWDIESRKQVDDLQLESNRGKSQANCISLCWSSDGSTLFAGYTDNTIRVWQVTRYGDYRE